MDKEAVLNIIEQFKLKLIEKGVSIDRIVLFGSYATETQKSDSDIDLIVISDTFRDMNYWQRIDILADAISDIFQPIEAVGMTSEEWDNKVLIAAEYARSGILV